MSMTDYEKAGWLADKIPAYGDYAKCAANLLRKQADQIVTISAALLECEEEVRRLRRGEFICKKCGIRKDSEGGMDHGF